MSKRTQAPKFKSESQEADWWASPAGRSYVKRKSAEGRAKGSKDGGSEVVASLKKKSLVQARKIAERKGSGYQTLPKMLVR